MRVLIQLPGSAGCGEPPIAASDQSTMKSKLNRHAVPSALVLAALALLGSSASPAFAFPKWLLIVFRDAGGVLTSLGNGGTWQDAACAGAGASLAFKVAPEGGGGSAGSLNSLNRDDRIGALHNQIVSDYTRQHKTFNERTYIAFLETNKSRYVNGRSIKVPMIRAAIARYGAADLSNDDLLSRLAGDFEAAGIKTSIVKRLEALPDEQSYREFNQRIRPIETDALAAKDLKERQREIVAGFFSTLRHSATYNSPRSPR